MASTLTHTLIYTAALLEAVRNSNYSLAGVENKLATDIPWLLLPDAIRAYVGPRQISHFEQHPDDPKKYSWMKYPTSLKNLSKENIFENIEYHLEENLPKCVIGEKSLADEFLVRNWQHEHFTPMYCHITQDVWNDFVLRNMVDVKSRLDDVFIIRHNGKKISGKELREQVAIFEKLCFFKMAEFIYNNSDLVANQEWFDIFVYEALKEAYPADLADNTYKYMKIDDDMNARISNLHFELTSEEKASVIITNDLDKALNEFLAFAYRDTFFELKMTL